MHACWICKGVLSKWSLNSIEEDCTQCNSSPVITASGSKFQNLVSSCDADASVVCPYNIPIGCWDTSEVVTDMAYAFSDKELFDDYFF